MLGAEKVVHQLIAALAENGVSFLVAMSGGSGGSVGSGGSQLLVALAHRI